MITVNVHEAKTRLSHYLALVAGGETVTVCKRNIPVAELGPVKKNTLKGKRPLGLSSVKIDVPPSFFEPLPDYILEGFNNPK
jgi:antitoxin (DNA-binding transcriptional repressor) of toxin-antitoxin stability system